MNTHAWQAFRHTAIAAALLAGSAQVWPADADDLAQLTQPGSSASAGIGVLTHDAPRFGQYTGLREDKAYGLFDLDLVKRDDATGTWIKFTGRNLGLDSRELRFDYNRQGDWGYFIEFSQIPRFDPYTVNTGLSGIGTSTQTVNGMAVQPVKLETNRDRTTLGFDKILARGFDVQVRFRNEEKDGQRLFGQGTFGTWNFLTDPINYTMRQLEATVGYTTDRLQLSGGYYGTDFSNGTPALNVVGGIAGFTPIALPPGNQSHQVFLNGGYSFTPTTRGTFKVAYSHLTQNDAFVAPAIVARTDLGGEINTTLLQAAVTARPMPKLSVLASLRYEDRNDKTPILPYLTTGVGATSTLDGNNEPRSIEATTGKVEASYALPMGFRATGGLDYDLRERNTYRVRSVSHRDETEEISYRAELRRSMSETVTGALSYVYSDRGGSDFLTTVLNNNTVGSNLIHPLHLADRERNKVRLTVNWQPTDPLTLQFFVDYAQDKYSGRTLGPREGEAQTYSIDAAYVFSDKWQANAWVSRNDTRADQSTCVNASATGVCGAAATPFWNASLSNIGNAIGLGLRGKPYSWLEVGAEAQHSYDTSEYRLANVTAGTDVSLPDTYFDVIRLNVFGKYALRKNTSLRLNYIYERWGTDDWTWANWTYSDGTRVLQDTAQKVHFLGLAVQHRWQ